MDDINNQNRERKIRGVDPRELGPAGANTREAGPAGTDPREAGPPGANPREAGPAGADPREAGLAGTDPRETGPAGTDPKEAAPPGADPREAGPPVAHLRGRQLGAHLTDAVDVAVGLARLQQLGGLDAGGEGVLGRAARPICLVQLLVPQPLLQVTHVVPAANTASNSQ